VSKVILKDKKDLMQIKHTLEKDYKIVGSQDQINRDLEVEVLSVKFSKIGQKTFDQYPNLRWIVCRSHGYDNINIELAEKYNVGIVCTNPNTLEVAEWILKRISLGEKSLVLGAGKIGKKFIELYKGESMMITSKSVYSPTITKDFDTIVVTSSPTENPILTKELLKHFCGNVISISRPCCIDDDALLEAINDGRVSCADMDMLDVKYRKELQETGKCHYYGHIAWGNDSTAYTEAYFSNLFDEIECCLKDESSNVVLNRKRDLTNLFEL
jgi:lactate dehydrogenase-like 2-hydroxyacid dehydrogenase